MWYFTWILGRGFPRPWGWVILPWLEPGGAAEEDPKES